MSDTLNSIASTPKTIDPPTPPVKPQRTIYHREFYRDNFGFRIERPVRISGPKVEGEAFQYASGGGYRVRNATTGELITVPVELPLPETANVMQAFDLYDTAICEAAEMDRADATANKIAADAAKAAAEAAIAAAGVAVVAGDGAVQ